MPSLEPKKLALIRILEILKKHSDYNHPLLQDDIIDYLDKDYGITLERKAVSRNISLLIEAGYQVEVTKRGCYLDEREFEDSELRMLIDGVLSSRYITAKHSKDLIGKLCGMANKYFRSHIRNVYSVNEWSKTDNQALFYNIELIDTAIENNKQLRFDFNKYGTDLKLRRAATHYVSPYQLILHNQRYYLMAKNGFWDNLTYYRLDHITNMTITDKPAEPITVLQDYKSGINYKEIATALPYMYTDKVETIEFIALKSIIDQIVDWFGKNIKVSDLDDERIIVSLKASPKAMEHWAMQYINCVEIIKPLSLREKIKENIKLAGEKYK